MAPLWTIELLGSLTARHVEPTVTRFQTRQTGAVLADLAFYRHSEHPGERVAEIAWPEDDLPIARRKLKIGLSSLRRPLEPPGVAAGTVIIGTRTTFQLNPHAFQTAEAQRTQRSRGETVRSIDDLCPSAPRR